MVNSRALPPASDDPSGAAVREESVRAVLRHLRVIYRSSQEHSRWVERQCGVSATQLWAMWELFAEPGLTVSSLSRLMSVHQSTTSNMLDKLEAKGLVKRDRTGPDQRLVRLFLSADGVALLAEAPRPAQGALNDALALQRLPDHVLKELEGALTQLMGAMRIKDEKAAMKPLSEP